MINWRSGMAYITIACLVGTSTFSVKQAYAGQSIGLHCHFVPYSHCYFKWSIDPGRYSLEELLSMLKVELEYESVSLYPGFYDIDVLIGDNSVTLASSFRLEGDIATIDFRFSDDHERSLHVGEGREWGNLKFKTARIPWVVHNKRARSASLLAELHLNDLLLGSSSAYLEPVKKKPRCWLNEPDCTR